MKSFFNQIDNDLSRINLNYIASTIMSIYLATLPIAIMRCHIRRANKFFARTKRVSSLIRYEFRYSTVADFHTFIQSMNQ